MTARIGSLFSGVGGLDLAVEAVFGGRVIWQAEVELAAATVLARHFPDTPNLGDVTTIDWTAVPAVDVMCGGFPCQDVSAAGKRAGIRTGTRSGLWAHFADAIDTLQPPIVVIENVRGLLSAKAHRSAMEPADATVGDRSGTSSRARVSSSLTMPACAVDLAALFCPLLQPIPYGGSVTRTSALSQASSSRQSPWADLFSEQRAPFSETWPTSGMTRAGRLCPLPPSGPRTNATASSSSPTAQDLDLLPTPVAMDAHDARNETSSRQPGSQHNSGTTITDVLWRMAGLTDVEPVDDLLPTPTTADGTGGHLTRGGARSDELLLGGIVQAYVAGSLLPIPRALDSTDVRGRTPNRTDEANARAGETLTDVVRLLPTPQAHDAAGAKTPEQVAAGGKSPANLNETVTNYLAVERIPDDDPQLDLLATPQARDRRGEPKAGFCQSSLPRDVLEIADGNWGKYGPAVRRWEALTRPAPAPAEPSTNGKPRVRAEFSEWMMGWPEGWVTATPNLTRTHKLVCIGNGVVTHQAVAALRDLLSRP